MLRQFGSSIRTLPRAQAHFLGVVSSRFQSTDYSSCEGLQVETRNQVLWMTFDRPKKYNALLKTMYVQITELLNKANSDDSIKAVVVTGNGDYYSSGNDLTNLTSALKDPAGPEAALRESSHILFAFVNSMVNFDKIMIAAVNGPAVGIPVTTLPLFDHVIASDRATFQSPFTALGQSAEACSSVTFPRIMGHARACEMLLLNKVWDAKKAYNYGLVSDVIEHDKFHEHLDKLLYGKQGIVSGCYPNALKVGKGLIRDAKTKQELIDVNKRECEVLLNCWLGSECTDALSKFFKRSK